MEIRTEIPNHIYTKFIPEVLEEVNVGRHEAPIKSWVYALLKPALREDSAVDKEKLRQEVAKTLAFTTWAKPAPYDEKEVRAETVKEIIILAAVKRISKDNLEEFLTLAFPDTHTSYKDALEFVRAVESGKTVKDEILGDEFLVEDTLGAGHPYYTRRAIPERLPKSR